MLIRDFMLNVSGRLAQVHASGDPLEVKRYRKKYVTVVPTEKWEEAAAALAEKLEREQGAAA